MRGKLRLCHRRTGERSNGGIRVNILCLYYGWYAMLIIIKSEAEDIVQHWGKRRALAHSEWCRSGVQYENL